MYMFKYSQFFLTFPKQGHCIMFSVVMYPCFISLASPCSFKLLNFVHQCVLHFNFFFFGDLGRLLLLLSHFSRVQLSATPWTAAHQAPLSMGFSRQECWSGVTLPSLLGRLVPLNLLMCSGVIQILFHVKCLFKYFAQFKLGYLCFH